MQASNFNKLSSAARKMLKHYISGQMYTWLNQHDGELGWIKASHRGVIMMSNLHIGRAVQKVLDRSEFEFTYNQNFAQVVQGCADLSREGKTWITPELAASYNELFKQGFAYSCEARLNSQLVGGVFGVQVGSFISMDSTFHSISNAGKAVLGFHLLNLQNRGFHFADVNYASEHTQRFGADWMPQWQFEKMMRPVLHAPIALQENLTAPAVPWHVLAANRAVQIVESAGQKLAKLVLRQPASEAQAA